MRKRIKGVEDYKIYDEVFDKSTLLTLYGFANKGVIDLLYGTIKTGKEANIFLGKKENKSIAVKIHRVGTRDYRKMQEYIDGDPRFTGIKRGTRNLVNIWVQKEFKNLKRASEHIRVPEPIAFKNNVIIMEFLGEGEEAYPMLKNTALNDPKKTFNRIKRDIRNLYQKAGLVHADMSEYNILMARDEPVLIDFAQAVVKDHPHADEFLKRDVLNIKRFFEKYFEIDEEKLLKQIRG